MDNFYLFFNEFMACLYLYMLMLITDLNPLPDTVDTISLILMFIFVVTFLVNLLYALGSLGVTVYAGIKRIIKINKEKLEDENGEMSERKGEKVN